MDLLALNRIVVPVSVVLFFILGMIWPTLRTYRRTGVWPITLHRVTDPAQRVIGRAMSLSFAAIFAWAIAYAALGPSSLDVWQVPEAVVLAGWVVMVFGLLLMLLAQAQMGASWRVGIDTAPTSLVTGGLFRVVRNPIFSAMLVMLAGLVLTTPSGWTVMGWLSAATLIVIQTRLEETHLLQLHGAAYRAYAARVGRFVPGVGVWPAAIV